MIQDFGGLGEGVAVEAYALGGGELGKDLGVEERDAVVAGADDFIGVGEAGAVALVGVGARAGGELDGAGAGHDEEVEEVAAAGAAEMGVGEAHDAGVGDVITGAPVPVVVPGVGRELDGAEGDGCAGEAVAVTAGADARVDVLKRVVG